MSEKRKSVKATSPKGSIMWFKLVKPDAKFKKYTVDLIVEDSPEIRKIINTMDTLIEETLKEEMAKATEKKDFKRKAKLARSKNSSLEEQLDAQGQPTGKFVMKFRLASSGKKKDDSVYQIAPPALFNAQAKPYTDAEKATLQVFNGSIGQVSFEMSPYAMATGDVGVSLKPKAVMIHKIQQVAADASQFGFSASELQQDSEFAMEPESETSVSGEDSPANEDF
jgi:hypothetical protein